MPERQILRRFDIEGVGLDLCSVDGRWVIARSADGEEIVLADDEATEVFNERGVSRNLDLLGIDLGQQPSRSIVSDHRRALLTQLPHEELLVMLDTSTLGGADLCLGEPAMCSPLCLLELSVLTFALICFDRVVVQPSGSDAMLSRSDAFARLDYPPDFVAHTLWSLCAGITNNADPAVDVAAYTRAWAAFLGVGDTDLSLNLNEYNKHQDSPYQWDGVFAHAYFGGVFSAPLAVGSASDRRSRDAFLSIQTMRTLFNDRLAGYLGLPYLASSLRAPIHALLLTRKVERQLVADRLLATLGPPQDDVADSSAGSYMAEISAPFLLGLVLEQMTDPGDYWRIVGEYRTRFAPLRARIARDRGEWRGRAGPYLQSLLKPIAEVGEGYTRSIDGAAIVTSAIATAIRPDVAAAGAGIKLARLAFPTERVRRAYYRRFRPELHLLLSLSSEAAQLRAVEDQVARVWGKTWERLDHEMLRRLAATQPPDFARLRSLA